MSDRPSVQPTPGRKPYSKPAVTQVLLRPEEAVLGNCKAPGQKGPLTGSGCVAVTPCRTLGS